MNKLRGVGKHGSLGRLKEVPRRTQCGERVGGGCNWD